MAASTERRNAHRLGVLLVTASTVVFSLAGVLTKAIESDAWTIACWRGLIGGGLILAYVAWRGRGVPARRVFRLGWQGWILATVGSAASLAFIFAFKLTYVANVAVIYATAPFLAAGLGWFALRERLRTATFLAAGVSFMGVAIVVSGGLTTGSLWGDAAAFLMTLGCALYMVLVRLFKETPVVLAGGASAIQLFAVAWFVADPLAVSSKDALLLSLFGLSFAVAAILWTEGTRLIPAAESGLLGSAETPFAVLFAWLLLAELPPAASFLGGAVVLAAVIAHILWVGANNERPTDKTVLDTV